MKQQQILGIDIGSTKCTIVSGCTAAGEVGHIRMETTGSVGYGKAGSFEGFCSEGGIAQLARTLAYEKLQVGDLVSFCDSMAEFDNVVNARTVTEAALAGDMLACEVYRICGQYIGKALAMLVDVLNPEVIILGDIYGHAQALIEPSMRKVIECETMIYSLGVCKIIPARLSVTVYQL